MEFEIVAVLAVGEIGQAMNCPVRSDCRFSVTFPEADGHERLKGAHSGPGHGSWSDPWLSFLRSRAIGTTTL
jgi:hypothetical protein